MKYILQITAAFVLWIIGKYFSSDELRPHFIAAGFIVFITLLVVDFGYELYSNYNKIVLIIRCRLLALKGRYIRFSMGYQYRIKINDKYLLVKNSNWDSYQHVGGKYKRLPTTQAILNRLGAKDDIRLPTIGLMKDDLAVFIPAKNAIKFINWFNTKQDREISHWREFYEELIGGKGSVLSQKNFPYINYTFVKSVITPLKRTKAPGWNCWEILQYDVLDILPDKNQEQELDQLYQKGDTSYIKWADAELLENLGFNKHERKLKYNIGEHAKWVVDLKYTRV